MITETSSLKQKERDLAARIDAYLNGTRQRAHNPTASDILRMRELQTDRDLLDIQQELVSLRAAVDRMGGRIGDDISLAIHALAGNRGTTAYSEAFAEYVRSGKISTALQADDDQAGGFPTAPAQ